MICQLHLPGDHDAEDSARRCSRRLHCRRCRRSAAGRRAVSRASAYSPVGSGANGGTSGQVAVSRPAALTLSDRLFGHDCYLLGWRHLSMFIWSAVRFIWRAACAYPQPQNSRRLDRAEGFANCVEIPSIHIDGHSAITEAQSNAACSPGLANIRLSTASICLTK